jgi:GT2 family glycosyltransferase
MPRYQIVIPVFNRLELTRQCLASLTCQSYKDFAVFLVDDGSTDGTEEAVIREFSSKLDIEILKGDGNLWWAGGIKMGVERALQKSRDGDYIVTLNNDVIVMENFLSQATSVIERYPRAMIGGLSVDSQDRKTVTTTGWRMVCWPLALTHRVWWPSALDDLDTEPPVVEVDFLPGTATFVPVPVVRRLGTVDARALPHYHADSEYSYRLKRNGVPVLISKELIVFHNLSSTGVLSNVRERPGLREIVRSFVNKKSGNCLRYKWEFAKACSPCWAIAPFLISDTIKVTIRSLGAWLIGEGIEKLRALFN